MSEHELWNELGNLYFMSNAYDQAIHAYRRSIQIESGFGRPYSNLALTYAQRGNYEEAIRLFRRGIELLDNDKEKAISWMRLGNVFRRQKDYREAVLAYQHADELDPQSSENRDEPGQGLYTPSEPLVFEQDSVEENSEAEPIDQQDAISASSSDKVEDAAIIEAESSPDIPTDLNLDEPVVAETSDCETKESPIEADIEEDSDSGNDSSSGHWVLIPNPDELQSWPVTVPAPEPFFDNINDESPEGLQETISMPDPELEMYYEEAEQPDPTPSFAGEKTYLRASGQNQIITQQTEVDVDELPASPCVIETAPVHLEDDEDTADSLSLRGLDVADIGKAEIEIERMRRVVQLNPRNGFAWDTLGTLYKSVNRFKEAILAYQQAISTDSTKTFYYHHLGLAYAADGRDEDAVSALQKVVELDPGHSLAHATLGGYYRKMGLDELAQKHIGKAMKNIYDSENEYNRACLEAICGHADQAIQLLQVALEKKQTYVDWVLRDPDLDFIRQDSRFKQLISDFTR